MPEAYSLWRPVLLPLCLRACSRTGQNHSTVLFQDSAIMVAKTIALCAQKPNYQETNVRLSNSKSNISNAQPFFSEAGFFPLMMSIVAKQRVMRSGLVRELAHRHKAMMSARKRKA